MRVDADRAVGELDHVRLPHEDGPLIAQSIHQPGVLLPTSRKPASGPSKGGQPLDPV